MGGVIKYLYHNTPYIYLFISFAPRNNKIPYKRHDMQQL